MDHAVDRRSSDRNVPVTFAIVLSRLPAVENVPGLISFLVDSSGEARVGKSGTLTDAALRGRLAHFEVHSANEIAAVRKALSIESGQATVYENWPALDGCLRFWYGFVGSVIRPIAWTCEACQKENRDSVGGSVGEAFLRRCDCGHVSRVTVPNHQPSVGALKKSGDPKVPRLSLPQNVSQ
jgi:hypothetical protein